MPGFPRYRLAAKCPACGQLGRLSTAQVTMPMRDTLRAVQRAYYGCDYCGVIFVHSRPASMPAEERRTIEIRWNAESAT